MRNVSRLVDRAINGPDQFYGGYGRFHKENKTAFCWATNGSETAQEGAKDGTEGKNVLCRLLALFAYNAVFCDRFRRSGY